MLLIMIMVILVMNIIRTYIMFCITITKKKL